MHALALGNTRLAVPDTEREDEVGVMAKDVEVFKQDAIKLAGIKALCTPRSNGTLMHNKFLVLTVNDKPQALLFGSSNLTENGIFGHANCTHVV